MRADSCTEGHGSVVARNAATGGDLRASLPIARPRTGRRCPPMRCFDRMGAVNKRRGAVKGRRGAVKGRRGAVDGRRGAVNGRRGAVDGRRGCGHTPEGRGHAPEGCSHTREGCGQRSQGRGRRSQGCGHTLEGRGQWSEGRGHTPEGCSHTPDGCRQAPDGCGPPIGIAPLAMRIRLVLGRRLDRRERLCAQPAPALAGRKRGPQTAQSCTVLFAQSRRRGRAAGGAAGAERDRGIRGLNRYLGSS